MRLTLLVELSESQLQLRSVFRSMETCHANIDSLTCGFQAVFVLKSSFRPAQGFRDKHMSRLAKCSVNNKKEGNQRRNLHALVIRTGRQLNISISHVKCPVQVVKGGKVKRQKVDWPVVHFSQWLECMLNRGGELILGGHHISKQHAWQSTFDQFWLDYKNVDSGHPIFSKVDPMNRKFYIPYTVHGDEGRGRNKVPVLIESFCPIISYKGIEFTNLSGYFG